MQPGTSVGPFEIVSAIGAGGMGEVFRARDTRLERDVAVKLLPVAFVADERAVERFSREARAASALNHPNIVTIYDIGESAHGRYIAMELVRGRTLHEFSEARGNTALCADVVAQCAEALAVAHQAGIVHRDIKPENVMVRDDGYVKVLDFGLARLVGRDGSTNAAQEGLTEAGMVLGTVRYLSPEQGCGEIVDGATDIFALGVVLYELLTGVHPFQASTTMAMLGAILSKEVEPPSRHDPEIPADVDELVVAMLAKDASARPAAAEVSERLRSIAGSRRSGPTRVGGGGASGVAAPVPSRDSRALAARARAGSFVVGRDADRARFFAIYAEAVHGHGSVLCIVGEPGIGKSTLVEDCLARLAADSFPVSLARGRCSERLAGTEAYLPFLEALDGVLQRDRHGVVKAAMERVAPTWYASVRSESAERITESADLHAVSQETLKREMMALLVEASRAQPVVFSIDDLQWADASTVDLLSYIAPRLPELRVLVVVTFRSSEMRMSKHLFLQVQLDLQSRGIAREMALDFLSARDVSDFLNLQYPGHVFPPEFARVVHDKTEGSPLFMADVVRYLGAQGVIAEREGRWALARSVPDIERDLPQSVRSMIERKIEQLGESDRRLLALASVQGYEFDSAIVAAVLGVDPADVEEQLLTLERVYVFVKRVEELELPNGTLSVRYRFVHVLYQNALYAAMAASRRVSHSLKVAEALERHYGDRATDVASQLAPLYEAARERTRAATWYAAAAKRAFHVFAYAEAEALAHRGLEQAALVTDAAERVGIELALHLSLGFTNLTRKGFADPETARHMSAAQAICAHLGDVLALAPVLFGLCLYHIASGQMAQGIDDAERLVRITGGSADSGGIMTAHSACTGAFTHAGRFSEALEQVALTAATFDPARRAEDRGRFLSDPYLQAACEAVRASWITGRFDEARRHGRIAQDLARAMRDPRDTAFAGLFLAELELEVGRYAEAEATAAAAIALCEEFGVASERLWNAVYHGAAVQRLGRAADGLAEIEGAVGVLFSLGALVGAPEFCGYKADCLLALGRPEDARAAADQGLGFAGSTGERAWNANLLRIRGDAFAALGDVSSAEDSYRQAMITAGEQGALTFELRAALGLARCWGTRGRDAEAQALLRSVHVRFPPARDDVADLRIVANLLAESPVRAAEAKELSG